MWPPSSPPYQPVMCVHVEVRDAALDALGRVLERRRCSSGVVLRAPDLGARDLLERRLDLREAVVDDRLVAVEREAHDPAADLELARDPVDHLVRDRARRRRTTATRLENTDAEAAACSGSAARISIVPSSISSRSVSTTAGEVVVVPDPQPARHVALRRRHQPDAHLRDDPVVRLHEELVGRRAEAALVDVPGLAVRASRPCPVRISSPFGEHDLHPALHAPWSMP